MSFSTPLRAGFMPGPGASETARQVARRLLTVASSSPNGSRSSEIFLSIVLPIWNGAERLPAALAEVLEFIDSRPFRSELVLADDGSGPATVAAIDSFGARHESVVVLRHLPHRGKGFAVAAGMGAARGRYKVFID